MESRDGARVVLLRACTPRTLLRCIVAVCRMTRPRQNNANSQARRQVIQIRVGHYFRSAVVVWRGLHSSEVNKSGTRIPAGTRSRTRYTHSLQEMMLCGARRHGGKGGHRININGAWRWHQSTAIYSRRRFARIYYIDIIIHSAACTCTCPSIIVQGILSRSDGWNEGRDYIIRLKLRAKRVVWGAVISLFPPLSPINNKNTFLPWDIYLNKNKFIFP